MLLSMLKSDAMIHILFECVSEIQKKIDKALEQIDLYCREASFSTVQWNSCPDIGLFS